MVKYIDYSYVILRKFLRKANNPAQSATTVLVLMWGLDVMYLLEILVFNEQLPNTISIISGFVVAVVIFIYSNYNLVKKYNKSSDYYYKYSIINQWIFIIQVAFTLIVILYFFYKYVGVNIF